MRTTLTLDDDVAAAIRSLVEEGGEPFKAVVNRVLRLGLSLSEPAQPREVVRIEPVVLGARYPNLDDIAEVLLAAEGEDHR